MAALRKLAPRGTGKERSPSTVASAQIRDGTSRLTGARYYPEFGTTRSRCGSCRADQFPRRGPVQQHCSRSNLRACEFEANIDVLRAVAGDRPGRALASTACSPLRQR